MKNIFILAAIFILSGCSVFQTSDKEVENQTTTESTDEVYVFDEVSETEVKPKEEKELKREVEQVTKKEKDAAKEELDVFDEKVKNTETLDNLTPSNFYLQLGAFSTLKRAEQFVNENNSKIDFVLSIIYNSKTSLYNVRSSPFNSKPEVENIRDDFWGKNLFKDAFIVTE